MAGYGTASTFSRPPAPDGEWRARAVCRNHPRLKPVTWDDHPGPGHRETTDERAKRTAAAKAVCWNECPVRQPCLDDVDLNHDEGIRGGRDLRALRAARRRASYRASA